MSGTHFEFKTNDTEDEIAKCACNHYAHKYPVQNNIDDWFNQML